MKARINPRTNEKPTRQRSENHEQPNLWTAPANPPTSNPADGPTGNRSGQLAPRATDGNEERPHGQRTAQPPNLRADG